MSEVVKCDEDSRTSKVQRSFCVVKNDYRNPKKDPASGSDTKSSELITDGRLVQQEAVGSSRKQHRTKQRLPPTPGAAFNKHLQGVAQDSTL